MSEVTSRPRVRSVSAASLAASAMGAGVVMLTGVALRSLVERVDPVLAAQLRGAPRSPVQSEVPALGKASQAQLAAERALLSAVSDKLPPLQALKLSVLSGLDAAGYAEVRTVAAEPIQALISAPTLTAVEHARTDLLRALHASHLQALVSAVTHACAESSRSIAFDRITVDPHSSGTFTRVVATDAAGRTLVSEISVSERDVRVETEVVGVRDGSCSALLDQFDAEMARRGVEAEPSRRSTGGICQLMTARSLSDRLLKTAEPGRARTGGELERRRRANATSTRRLSVQRDPSQRR